MTKYLDYKGLETYTTLLKQHITNEVESTTISVSYDSDSEVLSLKIPTTVEITKED